MSRVVGPTRPEGGPGAPPASPSQLAAVHQAAGLAAELHDGVSQHLFAAELDLHDLLGRDLDPEVRAVVERLGRHVGAGSRELRRALFALVGSAASEIAPRPGVPIASDTGVGLLTARITDLVSGFRDRHDVAVSVHVEVDAEGAEPAPDAARVLYRTAREGLTNVVKHANAERSMVALLRIPGRWSVEVHDDGDGDPEAIARHAVEARSFGLFSLLGDAARVGGQLQFHASPVLSGLRLRVTVPADAAASSRGPRRA